MKKQKIISVVIGLAVIAVAAAGVLFAKPSKPMQNPPKTPPASTTSGDMVKKYSLADVALHSTPANCWTTINGNVYDLTAWISKHPGGEAAILSLCGKDGSSAFNAQHGGQSNPEKALETFIIGTLQK